jgi:hypothetical protein
MTNTWVVGLIIAAVAAIGRAAPRIRWLNAAAATWLFFSTIWLYHASRATGLNNAIVAVAVLVLSVVSTASGSRANLA